MQNRRQPVVVEIPNRPLLLWFKSASKCAQYLGCKTSFIHNHIKTGKPTLDNYYFRYSTLEEQSNFHWDWSFGAHVQYPRG